jgi:hypothetical protein
MHELCCKRRFSRRGELRLLLLLTILPVALSLIACGNGSSEQKDYVYVAVPEASLRDRVSTVYTKTGLVHNGERLQVLERMQNKRFVRVRTPRGEEGWIQDRYLADQQTFDQFQQLAEHYSGTPAQATATIQDQVKVHVLPGRKTGYLYLLNDKQKVDLLERQVASRNARRAQPVQVKDERSKDQDKDVEPDDEDDKPDQPKIMEDWWLIRDEQKRVGWVYGRTLYLDVPDDIAQYSEGQRIVAAFMLDEVTDGDKKVPEYLVLLTDNKDGMPYDFNQIRIFTWNLRRHRYETAYREHDLNGVLPVTLGEQDFGNEGKLRTFLLQLKGDGNQVHQQLYKFNPPLVHKVYAPGEEPAPKPRRKKSASEKAQATRHSHHRQG